MSEELEALKEEVNKLQSLLSDPHIGLISWCQMVDNHWRKIAEMHNGVQQALRG